MIPPLEGTVGSGQMTATPVSQTNSQPSAKVQLHQGPFGDYDAALVRAIQNRWEMLLKEREAGFGAGKQGKVTVRFNLHPNGSISNLAVVESTLDSDRTKLSQAAVSESAPFEPWPEKMKRMVGTGSRELTFTFSYK